MAVAVDDSKGLMVPVIHHAEEMNLVGLSRAVIEMAEKARTKTLSPDEMAGGTFTITNPGVFGALMGTPIIPEGQVAILDVEAIVKRPVVVSDQHGNNSIAIRHMMFLCLSYDHRLVDGAYAAQFMAQIKKSLEGGTSRLSGCDRRLPVRARGDALRRRARDDDQPGGRSLPGRDPRHRDAARARTGDHAGLAVGGRRRAAAGGDRVHRRGIEVVEVNRGGRSTYHGPGQLVCYPVLDLRDRDKDLHRYVASLERAVIVTLAGFGLEGRTVAGDHASGVWVGDRKIASIGVRCARWVTTHGLSLNVDLDLGVYELFDACGLAGAQFTSIAAETGRAVTVDEVRPQLLDAVEQTFEIAFDPLPAAV